MSVQDVKIVDSQMNTLIENHDNVIGSVETLTFNIELVFYLLIFFVCIYVIGKVIT